MGHGHTPDIPGRDMSYENMAEDTAALLQHLGIEDADFIGWSDGGQIALRLAFTHPELVRRVVASGVGFGAPAEMARGMSSIKDYGKAAAEMFPDAHEEYNRISPDGPGHWTAVANRVRDMWCRPAWGFQRADLASIQRPVLIMAGDRDAIPLGVVVQLFQAIPKAQLYIVPGSGHSTFQDRPELVNPVLEQFLTGPAAAPPHSPSGN